MTTTHQTSLARPARQLLGLTSTLLALQVLNLAVFDDLRTDPLAGVVETFTKPQHLSSILCVLLAVVLVATASRRGRRGRAGRVDRDRHLHVLPRHPRRDRALEAVLGRRDRRRTAVGRIPVHSRLQRSDHRRRESAIIVTRGSRPAWV